MSETRTSKVDLKKYIHYCRTEYHPRLSESAASRLKESYVKLIQVFILFLDDTDNGLGSIWFLMIRFIPVNYQRDLGNKIFYLKTGTCKFGSLCKFHHSKDKQPDKPVMNNIGLPMRQST
ncbi:hypothetical protein CASFOL_041971 [Castilleja foliolosa]|uniref:DNA helicase n=1 Tax=Castilleja foliolosa TaxID=1961234 RepID=A0ABD3B9G2_9LAMI